MKPSLKITLVTAGAVLFNIIFWHEKLALNSLFFDVFILWSVFNLYPSAFRLPVMKWLLAAHLITLAAVLFHNTVLSKIAFCSTLLLVVVFTQYIHRSVWYAAGSALMNYVLAPGSIFANLKLLRHNKLNFSGVRRSIRFLIIPILLLCAFFFIYSLANSVFKEMVNDTSLAIEKYFSRFFDWFSWQRFGFLMLGLFITGGLLLKSSINWFSDAEAKKSDWLTRKKNDLLAWRKTGWFDMLTLLMGKVAGGIMALRNENRTGTISLVLLNVLLLGINIIDIVYVWFGSKYNNDINFSEYVHEGTGLLIFSILLAMMLLLFFFRGNLNFYKRNKWLRYGAYAWLLQNSLLVISVLLRDYYYIAHDGLAYKRIGVLIFLTLVLAGLITVFIKIYQRKTAYYLLRVNAWIAIIMLVFCSCIHWDETIARYNLAKKETIALDVKFLLTLSDKTLPLLQQNIQVLQHPIAIPGGEGESLYRSSYTPLEFFEKRKKEFLEQQEEYSWLSWNAADEFVSKQLKQPVVTSSASK
ncbi:MAG: DUF4173 domain-containing protein [Ferruginibacter sp.]